MTMAISLGSNNQISVPEIYSYTGKVLKRKKFIFELIQFMYIKLSKHYALLYSMPFKISCVLTKYVRYNIDSQLDAMITIY
jgi:hypothetical protein